LYAIGQRGNWVPRTRGLSRFRLTLRFLRLPSPITFAMGSSSRKLSLPCRVLPIRARSVAAVRRSRLPGGLVPLRDINRRRHIWSASPTSQTVPSSAFRTPSMVSSATGLVGLFHPTATSRVHSPGVFPPMKPYRLVDGPYPRRWRLLAVRRLPAVRHEPAPRLQGFLFIGIRCSSVAV